MRELTVAEEDRKARIYKIQELLNQGYSAGYIKDILGTTYNSIRRYKDGDPDLLCRFPEKDGVSGIIEPYKEFIVDCLSKKMTFAAILREINKTNSSVKPTAFNDYCRKIKEEYGINNRTNSIGKEVNHSLPKVRYVKRKDILRYLCTGKGLTDDDYAAVIERYDVILYLERFMFSFRSIFKEKDKTMLTGLLEVYEYSPYSKIKSFVNGLSMDKDAVGNAVALPYSNGFLEGNVNRLKMIKRMMYGRAKMALLRVKILNRS